MNYKVISFLSSNQNWPNAEKRFLDTFGDVIRNENDIDDPWLSDIIKKYPEDSKVRGFYHYVWKPIFILQELKKLNDNDILFYLDAGCANFDIKKIEDSLCKFNESNYELAATYLSRYRFPISITCTAEFRKKYNPTKDFLYNYNHYQAGLLFMNKTFNVLNFIETWVRMMKEDYETVIRNGTKPKEEPKFRNNGGDQVYFQYLLYKNNVNVFNINEIDFIYCRQKN